MPRPKDAFDALYPCDFYTPAELLDPDRMYTIPEVGRLLQELEPDADLDPETEAVLIDWAVPWILVNAADLAVAEPETEDGPGWYGLRSSAADGATNGGEDGDGDVAGGGSDGARDA